MATFRDCDTCGVKPSTSSVDPTVCCPFRMSDGRMTDYRPRCMTQYASKSYREIPSSYDFRQFLIHNGSDLIQKNARDTFVKYRCGPCTNPYDFSGSLGELNREVCNARTCTFQTNNTHGLGTGRQYYNDDDDKKFQQSFIDQKQSDKLALDNQIKSCGISKNDLLWYPIEGDIKSDYERYSIPGGGKLLMQ